MAKITNNPLLQGVSGMVGGQFVIRQTRNGAVMANCPAPSTKPPTEAQKAARFRFRAAVEHAKDNRNHDEYKRLAAERDSSPFAVARKDFLNPPRITDINLSLFRGQCGDIIEVTATDDAMVAAVHVKIEDSDGTLVEQGAMVKLDVANDVWRYEATKDANTNSLTVRVEARDLAGNETRAERTKSL